MAVILHTEMGQSAGICCMMEESSCFGKAPNDTQTEMPLSQLYSKKPNRLVILNLIHI